MTKKFLKIIFLFIIFNFYFLIFNLVYAAQPLGPIHPPPGVDVGPGATGIVNIIKGIVSLLLVIGFIAALFCLLISAIGYIFSGGDPKATAAARGRIMACIVGLIILISIFGIIYFLQRFFGANIITGIPIPRL